MTLVETERVLVVPTALFHEIGHFQGFSGDVQRYVEPLLSSPQVSYRPRGDMEEDPSFKQLIPYVVFRYTDGEGGVQLFQYRRGTGQGEGRLHSKRSVGVGGHISTLDDSPSQEDAYQAGMQRELAEEVIIETSYQQRCIGLINDDQTPVGQVHLGVLHLLDVQMPQICSREPDILDAGFFPLVDLAADLDDFETWSQIAIRALTEF